MGVKKLLELSEDEYLKMEENLNASAKGRAFLRARDRRLRLIASDDLRRMVEAMEAQVHRLGALHADSDPVQGGVTHLRILRQELQEMSSFIAQTKVEIAALRPAEDGENRIMAASEELDAVVSATERATNEILNAVERIAQLAGNLCEDGCDVKRLASEIETLTNDILMACGFQDITGQRVTKVVNTLKYLERRVEAMIEIWDIEGTAPSVNVDAAHRKADDDRPDAHLLNGPQLKAGVAQNDIDALFSGRTDTISERPFGTAPCDASLVGVASEMTSETSKISQGDIDALFP